MTGTDFIIGAGLALLLFGGGAAAADTGGASGAIAPQKPAGTVQNAAGESTAARVASIFTQLIDFGRAVYEDQQAKVQNT